MVLYLLSRGAGVQCENVCRSTNLYREAARLDSLNTFSLLLLAPIHLRCVDNELLLSECLYLVPTLRRQRYRCKEGAKTGHPSNHARPIHFDLLLCGAWRGPISVTPVFNKQCGAFV